MNREDILKELDRLSEEHGKTGMYTVIPKELFNAVIDEMVASCGDNKELVKDSFDYLIPFRQVEFDSMKRYSENFKRATEYYESKEINESLSYFLGFYLSRRGVMNFEDIKKYIIFRRNRAIKTMIERPPSFNSTCIMTNIQTMSINEGRSKVIQKVLEPMYNLVMGNTKSFDTFCSLDENFKDY